MGAACFKAAGDGSPEPMNESWGGSHRSIGSAGKTKTGVSPSRSSHRGLHLVKGANDSRIDRDVHHASLGMESKSDSRSASSANSSTPNQCDARTDTAAGVNPHFRSVPKPVPFSPRRGFQILSDSAPSLKLEPVTTPRRQKPTSVTPTVSKLPEEYSVALSDEEDDDVPCDPQWQSQRSIEQDRQAWLEGGTSEFVEATAALQHYYASEMNPGGDSEMPGVSVPNFPPVPEGDTIASASASFGQADDVAFESALQTINDDDARAPEPNLLPHRRAESEIERSGHQATSIFDSPFVKQPTGNMWQNTSDSDLSSGAKDSAKNGGSNSAASSARRSKGGSLGPSAVPKTPQRVSKASSPDEKAVLREGRKKSKHNKSKKEPSLPRQRSGVSDVSEEGCTLGTSKSLPMIKSAKKSLFPHSGHHQSQNGSTSMIAGGNSLMGAGNSLMGGGSSWMGGGGGSLMGGGGSLLAPYGGMSMVSIGDASSHGSFMQGHPSMKNMPPGMNPAYMSWTGQIPAPNSMPRSRGMNRTTSGPIADQRVRRHNRMRALHAQNSQSEALTSRRSKTLSPELSAMLGRDSKGAKEKDREHDRRKDKHGSRSQTPHSDRPGSEKPPTRQGGSSVSASDTTDGRRASSKPSPSSTPPSGKKNGSGNATQSSSSTRSSKKQAAEQAAAKQMQEAVENAAKMQQQIQQASSPAALPSPVAASSPQVSPHGQGQQGQGQQVQGQGPQSAHHTPQPASGGKANFPPNHNAMAQQQMQMQNGHRQGNVPPHMMGMHQMPPHMPPHMHAQMAAVHAAAAQQAAHAQAAQAQMMLQPQNSRTSTSSSISLNPQAHPQARKGGMPMPRGQYGYHPQMQPQQMMHPQMAGPMSPVNMGSMMPPGGMMPHPQMGGPMTPPGGVGPMAAVPFPLSGGGGKPSSKEHGAVKSGSEKSSGTEKSSSKNKNSSKNSNSAGKGGGKGGHRHASSSPSPQGHPPRSSSQPRRKNSGRGPHSNSPAKSLAQSAADLRADAVAHIHVDSSPSAHGYGKVPRPRSSNGAA